MASNTDQIYSMSEDKTSFLLVDISKPIDLECKLFITKENQTSTLKDECCLDSFEQVSVKVKASKGKI